ncbi:hypothetical protein AAG570_008793 [Ranatra chinensis]|uniref:Hormone-sensitive lipase n=1 Tax=Ranatra chinensis TaxID=642074 RepID=A0ABD0YS19_9HEMI
MNGALTPPSQSPSPYYVLKDLCSDNIEYFKEDQSEGGQKLYVTLISIFNSLDPLICSVDDILSKASKYDFDPSLPANGYRSFVFIVEKIVQHSIKVCQQIVSNRSSYFFRKGSYARELDDCYEVISSLSKLLSCLQKLMSWNTSGGLFPTDHHLLEELLVTGGVSINQYCFYGRHLGFQFCESIAIILKALAILMASFSEVYYGGNRIMDSLWNGGKYLIDTELRAKRIVNISQYASAEFCKTFWFLGEMELMQRLPNFVSASLVVNKLITIEPEPFSLTSLSGQIIDIPIPSAHKGHAPLSVRLLSSVRRFGMLNETDGKEGIKMASKGLIFHCHGGGFVAQSSRSHETYLRQWASKIDCPILSVDYSLAPEAPYPRALEEVFFAYCWTISNAHILGSTAERIILAGDSAGANLNIGLTMKCIEYGIRLPDGLFLAYAPVVLSFAPSPSRTLCLLDPLLPFGFLLNCSKAYACPPDIYTSSPSHEDKLRRNINKQERNKCDISLPQNGGEVGNASEDFTGIFVLFKIRLSEKYNIYIVVILFTSMYTILLSSSTST